VVISLPGHPYVLKWGNQEEVEKGGEEKLYNKEKSLGQHKIRGWGKAEDFCEKKSRTGEKIDERQSIRKARRVKDSSVEERISKRMNEDRPSGRKGME